MVRVCVPLVLSDVSTPDAVNPFSNPVGLVLDSENNQAIVADTVLRALIAVDLTSGARSILSSVSTPDAVNAFSAPAGLVLDSENNRALVIDSTLGALIAVDLVNGQRVVMSR
jgi:hypothetical protein